jgi:hypothetical protein
MTRGSGEGSGMKKIAFAFTIVAVMPVLAASSCDWPCKKGQRCGHACISKLDTCHK